MIVRVVVPLPVSEAGLKLQALSDGRPLQDAPLNCTPATKPFTAVSVRITVPDAPWLGTFTKVEPALRTDTLPALGGDLPLIYTDGIALCWLPRHYATFV